MINLRKIKKNFKKNLTMSIVVFLAIIALFSAFYFFSRKDESKQIYQVLIMPFDQVNSDPIEDRRTSLKFGDVLLTQDEQHTWSATEMVSYLIIKMNLTEEQSQKLTQGIEEKLSDEEIEQEINRYISAIERQSSKEDLERFKEELKQRRELVQIRKYRINMDEFKGFDRNMLISGQPYQDKVYDWSIVEKK